MLQIQALTWQGPALEIETSWGTQLGSKAPNDDRKHSPLSERTEAGPYSALSGLFGWRNVPSTARCPRWSHASRYANADSTSYPGGMDCPSDRRHLRERARSNTPRRRFPSTPTAFGLATFSSSVELMPSLSVKTMTSAFAEVRVLTVIEPRPSRHVADRRWPHHCSQGASASRPEANVT